MPTPRKNDALTNLVNALKILPNVGPKSARRMAYQLLQHDRDGAQTLVEALQLALKHVRHCRLCNTFCEEDLCTLCTDKNRDDTRLMVVHMPADVAGMEDAHCHDGRYFVLMGQINPAQGMDLSDIALEKLIERIEAGGIEEIILATDFTAEGDATAYVLYELLKKYPCKISRLAKGMPLGGELEYVDAGTLAQAVYERKLLKN